MKKLLAFCFILSLSYGAFAQPKKSSPKRDTIAPKASVVSDTLTSFSDTTKIRIFIYETGEPNFISWVDGYLVRKQERGKRMQSPVTELFYNRNWQLVTGQIYDAKAYQW